MVEAEGDNQGSSGGGGGGQPENQIRKVNHNVIIEYI